jgi:hypothetical protein
MEPLRDPTYIMDNLWSYYWGWIFAALGVLGIIVMHVLAYWKKTKNAYKSHLIS